MSTARPSSHPPELDPALFARIKTIQIRTRHLVSSALAGSYESAFRGRGMAFEEVREYQPGDDVRNIDWNVTARMNAPYIKVHREERELTVMLVVDVSASSAFGTRRRLKQELAAEAAAIIALAAVKNNDRVGLIVFSDRVERYIPPSKGRAHVWRVIREILAFQPTARGTDLDGALEFMGKVTRRRAVAFLISDFLDSGFQSNLSVLARRHDLTTISISDPREAALPDVGIIALEDAETGERILVDTSDRRLRAAFAQAGTSHDAAQTDLFRSSGVGRIALSTAESPVDAIVGFFRRREGRR